jgi:hypothetical protein
MTATTKTTKVSDFKIGEYLVRNLCRRCGVQFIDVPVDFSDEPGVSDGKITVKDDGRLSKTVFQVVTSYLQSIETLTGSPCELTNEEKTAFVTYVAGVLRNLSYAKGAFPEAFAHEPTILYANRQPLVWIMLRDVICPAFNIPIRNVKIIAAKSARIDCARFIEERDGGPYVFLNNEVENQGVRTAYLLIATLDALGQSGIGVVSQALSRDEIWQKVMGLAQVALIETDLVNDFAMTLAILANFPNIDGILEEKKEAKWNKRGLWSQAQAGNLWWQLGLIEKMLDPARGPDWSGYFITKPFLDEFWEKVEAEKSRRGLAELPMELLLRVQSEEFKQRPDLTIQGLLADNRVW